MVVGKLLKYRLIFTAFIFILFVLPILLITFRVIPFEFRYHVLIIVALLILIFETTRKIPIQKFGFRKDNLLLSLKVNIIASLLLLGLILLIKIFCFDISSSVHASFFIFYVFIGVPIQEYLFRSVVFYEMYRMRISKQSLRIILSAMIFAFPHLVYLNIYFILIVVIMGIIWGYIYDEYPNWYGVVLSHALLGSIAIFIGLV